MRPTSRSHTPSSRLAAPFAARPGVTLGLSCALTCLLLAGCSGGGGSSSASSAAAPVTSGGSAGTSAGAGASGTQTIPREVGLALTAASAGVYLGPDATSARLGEAHLGETYAHLEQQGAWHKVQFSAAVGWIPQAVLAQSQLPARRVTAATLNVRSGPGTSYRQVGQLLQGQLVIESQAQGDWREISFGGELAWVHGAYLQGTGVSAPAARPTSSAGFIQLGASGDGFYSYANASGRWGLPTLIYGIERGGTRWKQTGFPRAGVGDISLERGGAFAPHASHRLGKNADFRPVRTSGESPVTITDAAYSRSRTQQLIDIMKAETNARSVLFNDSGVTGVTYYSGHHNHFHVSIP